jgi:hypothetical protein
MIWSALILTVIITTAIVYGACWIKRQRQTHPELYKNRGVIGFIVWLILQY